MKAYKVEVSKPDSDEKVIRKFAAETAAKAKDIAKTLGFTVHRGIADDEPEKTADTVASDANPTGQEPDDQALKNADAAADAQAEAAEKQAAAEKAEAEKQAKAEADAAEKSKGEAAATEKAKAAAEKPKAKTKAKAAAKKD